MITERDFYTIEELAEKLRTTKYAIYQSVHRGEEGKSIPKISKLGRRSLVKVENYDKWYKNL